MKFLNPIADSLVPRGYQCKYQNLWTSVYRLRGDTWLPVECESLEELTKLQVSCCHKKNHAPALETRRKGLILYVRPKKEEK